MFESEVFVAAWWSACISVWAARRSEPDLINASCDTSRSAQVVISNTRPIIANESSAKSDKGASISMSSCGRPSIAATWATKRSRMTSSVRCSGLLPTCSAGSSSDSMSCHKIRLASAPYIEILKQPLHNLLFLQQLLACKLFHLSTMQNHL